MKLYCEECDKFVNFETKNKIEEYNIMSKEEITAEENPTITECKIEDRKNITIDAEVAQCKECGKELYCDELDKKNQKLAFNKYREINNIMFPDEIKEIRQRYNLSPKQMDKILGWKRGTFKSYETGSLPTTADNNILRLIKKQDNIISILVENKNILKDDEIEKIKNNIINNKMEKQSDDIKKQIEKQKIKRQRMQGEFQVSLTVRRDYEGKIIEENPYEITIREFGSRTRIIAYINEDELQNIIDNCKNVKYQKEKLAEID